jgi:hypothetical protein
VQQQLLPGAQVAAAQVSHATARPLGEGLEDEIMFDYHHSNHMHHSAGSPLAREGSNMSDWQIKAGRTDSYLTRTRSSASLWHSEYQFTDMVTSGVCGRSSWLHQAQQLAGVPDVHRSHLHTLYC